MDRQAADRALARAIAYVQCGKPEQAEVWLTALVGMFEEQGVRPTVDPDPPAPDMRAASAWLGGRLLGREGSVQL